jgi:hypothetical protein
MPTTAEIAFVKTVIHRLVLRLAKRFRLVTQGEYDCFLR